MSVDCLSAWCVDGTQRYDRSASTSQSKSDVVTDRIPFGGGSLIGRTTTDLTCLNITAEKSTCVEKGFTFFEILKTENLNLASQYSGILGIAPDDPSNGPSFVAKLKAEGYIDKKMLSINMQKSPLSSYATFGGMSEFMMHEVNGRKPVYWYKSASNDRWRVKVHNLMTRDAGDNSRY